MSLDGSQQRRAAARSQHEKGAGAQPSPFNVRCLAMAAAAWVAGAVPLPRAISCWCLRTNSFIFWFLQGWFSNKHHVETLAQPL